MVRLLAVVLFFAWGNRLWAEPKVPARDPQAGEEPVKPGAAWYEEDLKTLAAENPKAEVYRLTVDRAFDPGLVFEMDRDAIFLRKTRLVEERKGNSIATSYRVVRKSRIPIDPEEFTAFGVLLEAGSFWNLPTDDWRTSGLDGSGWVLEGVRDGKYHRVIRSNPFVKGAGTPLEDDLKKFSPERAYAEGRLIAAFMYFWSMSGEANEKLY